MGSLVVDVCGVFSRSSSFIETSSHGKLVHLSCSEAPHERSGESNDPNSNGFHFSHYPREQQTYRRHKSQMRGVVVWWIRFRESRLSSPYNPQRSSWRMSEMDAYMLSPILRPTISRDSAQKWAKTRKSWVGRAPGTASFISHRSHEIRSVTASQHQSELNTR